MLIKCLASMHLCTVFDVSPLKMYMYTHDQSSAPAPTPSADTVLFSASKKELFIPSSGYKTLQNRLKVNWNVSLLRDDLTLERLSAARLVVFGGPRDKFSANEVR
jgi:hypothetical protein